MPLDDIKAVKASALAWPTKLVFILLGFDFSIVLLSFTSTLFFGRIVPLLHIDREGNLPTWYSSTKLFVLAVMFGMFASRNFKSKSALSWIPCFLAGLFFVFSLDEIAQIHERTNRYLDFLLPGGDRANSAFSETGLWMFFVGLPVFFFMLILFLKIKPYFSNNPKILQKYLIGFLIFMSGALGLEILINFVPSDQDLVLMSVVHAEEFLELIGVTTLIWATANLLQSYNLRINFDPVDVSLSKSRVSKF